MLLLASKATEILGVVFVILVLLASFGIAVWQLIRIKKQRKLEEQIKEQRRLEKQARKGR
jgi:cytochrome oxidase assembly protein ShyY1